MKSFDLYFVSTLDINKQQQTYCWYIDDRMAYIATYVYLIIAFCATETDNSMSFLLLSHSHKTYAKMRIFRILRIGTFAQP